MTTKVYGYLKTPDDKPLERGSIRFILAAVGAQSDSLYVDDNALHAYADTNGYFELNLWPNINSSVNAPYDVTIFQSGEVVESWEAYVPQGTSSISIDDLYALYKSSKGVPVHLTSIDNVFIKVDEALAKAAAAVAFKKTAEDAVASATDAVGRANTAVNSANDAINRANIAAATGTEVRYVPNGNLAVRVGSGFWQQPNAQKANGWPKDEIWYHLITSTHDNTGNNYSLQIAAPFFGQSEYYIRNTDNQGHKAWDRIITSGNQILKYTKIQGFKWYKAFKINNGESFQAANESTNVVFRILGQTDFGRTADRQTSFIEASFGVRGPRIRPVLTSKGDSNFGPYADSFQFRIYAEPRPGGGEDAYLYIRTPVYSQAVVEHYNIDSIPLFEEAGTIYHNGTDWVIPLPSTGRLMWDSANPTGGYQDMYVGNNKVYHSGDFDINNILARLAALEAK
ncbi:hypothetical protein [Deinococcus sp. Leaf326]|uniref:hypothetical protein n=1 Tax=Deinococcus sp. Leaf326 TaxID=1736338 RepID=UPI000A8F31DE|nr:hypothetical protein [Deinococcus sp. Leaf326]